MEPGSASSADYVNRICDTLPSDLFGPLAHFLRGEQHNTDDGSANFVWYCNIDSHAHTVPIEVSSPSELQQRHEHAIASGSSGGLIFLRGYPSRTWLREIGHLYQVSPDYWRQHLGFLSPSADAFPHEHLLPSTRSHNIIKLRLGSIGTRGRFRSPVNDRIEELRRKGAEDMANYADQLAEGGSWRPGNSVVRQYVLHDREHFNIEQYVTIVVCLRPQSEGRPLWTVIVFLDCGDDLPQSPRGPWVGDRSIQKPHLPQANELDATDTVVQMEAMERGPTQEGNKPTQSLSQVHIQYGTKLDRESRSRDPFYLLHDLFHDIAIAESQTLDLVAAKIRKYEALASSDRTEYETCRVQLLHFQAFLEGRIENMQNALDIVCKRGGTNWPKPGEAELQHLREVTERAAKALEEDYAYLLKRSQDLLAKIERSVTLATSLANIEETRRSVDQNTLLFRFTIVASFYIPLSFTTSLFGMNFVEFGQGILSIWVFFVVLVPILSLSVVALFVGHSWVERLQRRFRH